MNTREPQAATSKNFKGFDLSLTMFCSVQKLTCMSLWWFLMCPCNKRIFPERQSENKKDVEVSLTIAEDFQSHKGTA